MFTTCLLKIVAVRHWTIVRKSNQQQPEQQQQQQSQPLHPQFTTAKVQMSDTITSLNKLTNDNDNDDDEKLQEHQHQMYEGDENQENNGLKRQRLNDTTSVKMSKIRNKTQQQQLQTCATGDHMHENHLQTMRCLTTATESPINTANGTIPLKVTTTQHSISNGFHRIENGRESVLSTQSDDILAQLCDGQSEGYLDSMVVSSDLSDADMKLAVEKENATIADGLSNGNDQNGCDRAINRAHRRTRARSSDSIQAEFYQARKMRLQLQHDSDVS